MWLLLNRFEKLHTVVVNSRLPLSNVAIRDSAEQAKRVTDQPSVNGGKAHHNVTRKKWCVIELPNSSCKHGCPLLGRTARITIVFVHPPSSSTVAATAQGSFWWTGSSDGNSPLAPPTGKAQFRRA